MIKNGHYYVQMNLKDYNTNMDNNLNYYIINMNELVKKNILKIQ